MIHKIAETKEQFCAIVLLAAMEANSEIPYDILITIAALETGWGKRVIDKNLFNIKGKGAQVQTTEYTGNKPYKIVDNFRVYDTFSDSVADFIDLVKRKYPRAYENRHNPSKFFEELQHGGYATDPNYSQKLLKVFATVQKILKL